MCSGHSCQAVRLLQRNQTSKNLLGLLINDFPLKLGHFLRTPNDCLSVSGLEQIIRNSESKKNVPLLRFFFFICGGEIKIWLYSFVITSARWERGCDRISKWKTTSDAYLSPTGNHHLRWGRKILSLGSDTFICQESDVGQLCDLKVSYVGHLTPRHCSSPPLTCCTSDNRGHACRRAPPRAARPCRLNPTLLCGHPKSLGSVAS